MSEYNCTPGRGHQQSARERAMQVDRQPSPWPCAAILAMLLLFCLMAPHYWQNTSQPDDATLGPVPEVALGRSTQDTKPAAEFDNSNEAKFSGWAFDGDGISAGKTANSANRDVLNLLAPPTIEELIDVHCAMAHLTSRIGRLGNDGFDWPVLLRMAARAERERSQAGPQLISAVSSEPETPAAMVFVGGLLGEYALDHGVPRLVMQFGDRLPRWLSVCGEQCDSLAAQRMPAQRVAPSNNRQYTVRVLGPNDRLAMLPAPRVGGAASLVCATGSIRATRSAGGTGGIRPMGQPREKRIARIDRT